LSYGQIVVTRLYTNSIKIFGLTIPLSGKSVN